MECKGEPMSNKPTIKTRLDPLVEIRENDEKTARIKLAAAMREKQATEEMVQESAEKMAADHRSQGEVAQWIVNDTAHMRARLDHESAEEQMNQADESLEQARTEHEQAYQKARVLRRVADSQRQRQIDANRRKERQALDEIAILRFRTAQP